MALFKDLDIETLNTATLGRQYDAPSQAQREKLMKEAHPSLTPFALKYFPNKGKVLVKVKNRHISLFNYTPNKTAFVTPMELRELRIITKTPLDVYLYRIDE